jgi:hypothetical protein
MQRLITFLLVITAIILAILCGYYILIGKIITELVYLVGTLLAFATGSKVWSKYAEKKDEKELTIDGK